MKSFGLSITLKRTGKAPKFLNFMASIYEGEIPKVIPDSVENVEAWDQIRFDKQELLAAKVNGKVFLPTRSLTTNIIKENGLLKFKLAQYGHEFAEFKPDFPDDPVKLGEIEIFHRDAEDQLKELTIEIEKVPENLRNDLNIDLKLFVENYQKDVVSFNVPLKAWKSRLLDNYNAQQINYVISEISDDGKEVEKQANVILEKSQPVHEMIDSQTGEVIKAKTYMKFRVVPRRISFDPADLPGNYENLKNSFKHELTQVGAMSLSRLEKNLSITFAKWNDNYNNYAAPLVNLCQSSGSGKSKLSIECIKSNPGFYLVFRETEQTGYPRMNRISKALLSTIRAYEDNSFSQLDLQYKDSTVGKILHFFTRIFVSYVRKLCILVEEKKSSGAVDLNTDFNRSIHEIGSLFLDNTKVPDNFPIISDEEMDEIYKIFGPDLSVKTVANVFQTVMTDPRQCLVNFNAQSDVCNLLSARLQKFPFLFVLDEADILSNIKLEQDLVMKPITGLEIVRRALGYINEGSNSLFLTLGTRSDVADFNPPVVDFSFRLLNRKNKLSPITLTANSNIFSKEYPITELSPSYKLLRNPLMFKFLATLGHSLWSSYPFTEIIRAAIFKLKNGSADTKACFLPIWMLRTGLVANSLHNKANSLVAGHMATLHEVQDNLKKFVVSYPSEPILAMAGRQLTSEQQDDVALFDALRSNAEAVALDIGRYAQVFGAMIILRALDKTSNFARTSRQRDYKKFVDEIKSLTPRKFHSLWENETQLLESEGNSSKDHKDSSTSYLRYFNEYKVLSVSDFLKTLIKTDKLNELGIPKNILNGIVNANHFVTLTRDNIGFKIGNFSINPFNLPSADERLSDSSRNIIDEALLKIGLLRQCGFAMPTNYYGINLILPVCLPNNDLTFIGIKVKRSGADMLDDVFKMRSRLHLVQCPNKCTVKCNVKKCDLCLSDESLQNIYANQLSLVISLDDIDSKLSKFSNSVKFRSGISNSENRKILLAALEGDTPEHLSGMTFSVKSDSFLKPLVQKIVKINDYTGMAACLWDDKLVELPKKAKERVTPDFRPDGFVHRQYTLMTRGWNAFSHLFSDSDVVFKIANDMISNDGIFSNVKQRSDAQLVRSVIYDTSPSYTQYSDELSALRGRKDSNLDALDEVENNLVDGLSLEKDLDSKLTISPPESPKPKKNN